MKSMLVVLAAACSMLTAGAVNAQAGADLAKAKGCLGCHAVAEKKAGPSLKDMAAKYKGNKDAEATLIAKLKAGKDKDGKGHMKAAASDAELKTLVEWSLSAK
jgi:cytochrome c